MIEGKGPDEPPHPTTSFNRWKLCRFGVMLYNVNDRYVGRSLDVYGEFSNGESDVFRQLVRPGDVVVEVGANIGAHTLQLAKLCAPTGRVYAFEPQRLVFQALCANMALNSVTNAYCFQQAVGRTPGSILVPLLDPNRTNNFGGLALENRDYGEAVPLTTIDSLNLPVCRLLKVDAEGMEQSVLEGAAATIRRTRPILYVENDREAKSDALLCHLASLHYRLHWHKPPLFNPGNLMRRADDVFNGIISPNVLCVPSEMGVKIAGSAEINVHGELIEERISGPGIH